MGLPEGYAIRPFQPGDEQALSEITRSSIKHLGPRHYSHEQVQAWVARHPSPQRFLQRHTDGTMVFVAVAKDRFPVAYALLEVDEARGGHLDMLYCHHQHTRQGLADALLWQAENYARSQALPRLYTEASELARATFERAGYAMRKRRDFEIDGVAIHNYAMEKALL